MTTQRVVLWTAALLMAAAALVAGCVNVDVPKGPYLVVGDEDVREAPAEDRERIGKMGKEALEEEALRLAAENDGLRQETGEQNREIKQLKKEKDRLEDRIEDLEDRIEDLRKR